jgi:hypothetical protein
VQPPPQGASGACAPRRAAVDRPMLHPEHPAQGQLQLAGPNPQQRVPAGLKGYAAYPSSLQVSLVTHHSSLITHYLISLSSLGPRGVLAAQSTMSHPNSRETPPPRCADQGLEGGQTSGRSGQAPRATMPGPNHVCNSAAAPAPPPSRGGQHRLMTHTRPPPSLILGGGHITQPRGRNKPPP